MTDFRTLILRHTFSGWTCVMYFSRDHNPPMVEGRALGHQWRHAVVAVWRAWRISRTAVEVELDGIRSMGEL